MYITTTVQFTCTKTHSPWTTQTFKCIFTDWFMLVTKNMFWFL